MSQAFFEIPSFHDYISADLAKHLFSQAAPVPGIDRLLELDLARGSLEDQDSLKFLVEIYGRIKPELKRVLSQRRADRQFIDQRVKACFEFNTRLHRDFLDPDYQTVLGLEDSQGRIVFGPKDGNYCEKGGAPVAPIPDFLREPHVTLFGPPDSAKMAVNAMNAYHRKLNGEPSSVEKLLSTHESVPKWGADDEDSKTPLHLDLVDSANNLAGCLNGDLSEIDPDSGRKYELAPDHLSLPIKRIPGLDLPSVFLFFEGNPIPLHLYDFALHLFRHWRNPKALVFYIPKLENEEEAAYIRSMVAAAEDLIRARHPEYVPGTVRLMIVLENPRAILRTHEIMDALYPYFAGASLGWHDYLASTARVFKEDGNYRIPVKADPDIVIKYIKASHLLLADVVGSRGGIKVGGMYGVLPSKSELEDPSFQVTLRGFFKDVVTQLKRDLSGFWVAHPDFVRLGLAMVEAWKFHRQGDSEPLFTLIQELFEPAHWQVLKDFVSTPDIEGLDKKDPHYVRSLLVADLKESDFIANNDPEEIRYNVFQSLQYLTDWLCGNGCVALPAIIHDVPVRVMDDLATAERSRWEVWHELRHGRFSLERFLKIAHEELHFIRKDLSDGKKVVQVKWDSRTEKWYPVAFRLMLLLMTRSEPVEFATELLLPFTLESIRNSPDPWTEISRIEAEKYRLPSAVERLDYFFERCGSLRFASEMAKGAVLDLGQAEEIIKSFSVEEIIEAASFHGNIGESRKTLDARAAGEQARVLTEGEELKAELRALGEAYLRKFGFKFLISAQGRSGKELLAALQDRLKNPRETEIRNAQQALWEITFKRISEKPRDGLIREITDLASQLGVQGASIAIARPFVPGQEACIQSLSIGVADANRKVTGQTLFELASLSKTLASAFAIEYFSKKGIPLSSPVNGLLEKAGSSFRLRSAEHPEWPEQVTLEHLMSHNALSMHYVKGIAISQRMPGAEDLLLRGEQYSYDPVQILNQPGSVFHYSGGGFIVLEHLIESLEGRGIQEITRGFFEKLGTDQLTFQQASIPGKDYASGYFDHGAPVPGGRYQFPAFAAGAMGSAQDVLFFLDHLAKAHQNLEGSGGISHDTAVRMLRGVDQGSVRFMGCKMGMGVFIAEAGDNQFAVHQGANEGFRALYIHCFSGPDRGKGFVILCNADNQGVVFISRVAQALLKELEISGIDFERFQSSFDFSRLAQDQIVNLGYKDLIFNSFGPSLPEKIERKGPADPLFQWNLLAQAKILSVTNQRFARAENLISPDLPGFDPDLFGRQGKIMDSWESARHNVLEADALELELAKSSSIQLISISTQYHDGNQAEFIRLLGRGSPSDPWKEFLPKVQLHGHSTLKIRLRKSTALFSQVRVEMVPDGGLTRLGLYQNLPEKAQGAFRFPEEAQCVRFAEAIPKSRKPLTIQYTSDPAEVEKNWDRCLRANASVDFASAAWGGKIIKASNEHYAPAAQVISPFPPLHMFDGLESARSRQPGHFEEVLLELGKETRIRRLVMDFRYFVNNNPSAVSVHGLLQGKWVELVGKTNVKAFASNAKAFDLENENSFKQLLIRIYPDGGINRIHVYGD